MSFLLEFVCCAFFTIIPLTMCRLVQFQLRQTISDFISPGPPLEISQKGCINQSLGGREVPFSYAFPLKYKTQGLLE